MASSTTEAVTLTYHSQIALITLNRPSKLNALNQAHYHRLSNLLRDAAARPEVLVTVLTGTGRFFSAGADITTPRQSPSSSSSSSSNAAEEEEETTRHAFRENILRHFVANNIDLTHAFYSHPKILVTALNGPAVGLSAALIGFSDFIYAHPSAFVLTPFTSLGLVAEGGSSVGFVRRLGISKANEALIQSKRIGIKELEQVGFVNKVWAEGDPSGKKAGEGERFLAWVLREVREGFLAGDLNGESMLRVKELIRGEERRVMDGQGVREVLGGLERFVAGVPQMEFARLKSGEKKHKL